jgi:hypothetical protein
MMSTSQIKPGPWSGKFPDDQLRVGISRGNAARAGCWLSRVSQARSGTRFNSVEVDEYRRRYYAEILGPLDTQAVAGELLDMAGGRIPVLLCFERPGRGQWCHCAMASEWLAEATGQAVPEFGFETLPQHEHPLLPSSLHRLI